MSPYAIVDNLWITVDNCGYKFFNKNKHILNVQQIKHIINIKHVLIP
jgi:hypothetical protein